MALFILVDSVDIALIRKEIRLVELYLKQGRPEGQKAGGGRMTEIFIKHVVKAIFILRSKSFIFELLKYSVSTIFFLSDQIGFWKCSVQAWKTFHNASSLYENFPKCHVSENFSS